MQIHMFHLMPYQKLPADYLDDFEKYPAGWVTYPNTFFDPEEGARLYNTYLDQLEYAETLGFDGVCVNEHHQNHYGLMPAPNIIAALLARDADGALAAAFGAKSLRGRAGRLGVARHGHVCHHGQLGARSRAAGGPRTANQKHSAGRAADFHHWPLAFRHDLSARVTGAGPTLHVSGHFCLFCSHALHP